MNDMSPVALNLAFNQRPPLTTQDLLDRAAKGNETLRSESVVITLPTVGGVSYAFCCGLLMVDGEAQPPRLS